jgi:V/A-type H+-transporting ATPase subunit I
MLVKMKKATVLVSARQRETALNQLRKLGMLHVKAVNIPQSEDIDRLRAEDARTEKALSLLPAGQAAAGSGRTGQADIVSKILDLSKKRETASARLAEKRAAREWFRQWGDFSWSSVSALSDAGVFLKLYAADQNALNHLPVDGYAVVLGKTGGSVRIALFSLSPGVRLDLKEETIPPVEVPDLEADILSLQSELGATEAGLAALSGERPSLLEYRARLRKQLEFQMVSSGMGVEDGFVYIQGFCPHDTVPSLKKKAEQAKWGLVTEEPDNASEVPTLIRNPKWIRIVDPLIRFMGTVPGYDEKDISLWFLVFFTLFFAMLIGDAGYGVVFLALTFFARKKAGPGAPQEIFRLLTVTSAATVVWGAVSGVWFAVPQISRLPFFRSLIISQLDASAQDNSAFMMYLCFIIAVVQLTLAHVISAAKIINSPKALADAGWICILWPVFFLAGFLVLGRPMPHWTIWMFTAGSALTLVFSNFQKNILKGILETLTSLPFSILGAFSDTFSYLRLYAVGIAGTTVSSSFNDMLLGTGRGVPGLVVAVVFLFLIHALNMVLGCMSVIVHGVRLNLLEFSGHLGMSWTGRLYEPFRE